MPGWSFAATARTIGEVQWELKASKDHAVMKHPELNADQMQAAADAIHSLLATRLWGSGPFSVALSGTETNFYLSVVGK